MASLVEPLFDGPIDIIGDVHGELDALTSLLGHLGYHDDGSHAKGNRLVFLGDLTDRGPDSPAVVTLIQRFVESGRGQCVLGNHDLNILLDHRKFDNGWFFGEEFRTKDGHLVPQVLADDSIRRAVTSFFRTLPIALERPGVRVIHAYWDQPAIEVARSSGSVLELYWEHRNRIEAEHCKRPDLDYVQRELDHQNRNPVKLLTSGPERKAKVVVESSGRKRHCERVEWWPDYAEPERCVFGHYGIRVGGDRAGGRAFCVDYAVGKRPLERLEGVRPFHTNLAAFRLPEAQVVFEDGSVIAPDR